MRERSAGNALGWAFALTWGQRGFTILFTVLLAGILGPEAFGIVAMAGVFIAIVWLVEEQGVTTAIVQRENLEDEHLDSAFWINLVFCLALAGIVVALSGVWADLNDTPELQPVVSVLAIALVIWGLSIVQEGVLQRRLQFRALAIRANVSAFAGGVTGLVAALAGAGVWALVIQQLTLAAVSATLLWLASDWRPRLRFSKRHARDIVGFSTSVFVANVGAFVAGRGDILLMGLFFSPAVVGVYRLAGRLVDALLELTTRPVGIVSLPHFSRLQNDRAALRTTVSSYMRLVTLTTVPALLVLAASSEYVLAVIGPEWEVGADAMRLLCVVGIVKGLVQFTGPLLFAVAKPLMRALMIWVIAGVNVAVVSVVGAALAGASEPDQLAGMSGARALVWLAVVAPLNLFVIYRLAGLSPLAIAPWLAPPLAAGLASAAVVEGLAAVGLVDGTPPLVQLVVIGGAALGAALAVLLALEPRAREHIAQLRARLARTGRADVVATASPEAGDEREPLDVVRQVSGGPGGRQPAAPGPAE